MGPTFRRPLVLALLMALAVTAVLAWPLHAWRGTDALAGLALAGGLCLLGAVVGRVVARLLTGLDPAPERAPQATQVATVARMLVTLILALPVILLRPVGTLPFAVGLGAHYLSQMALEVFVSLRELGQNLRATGTPARASQPEAELPPGPTAERVMDAEGAADR